MSTTVPPTTPVPTTLLPTTLAPSTLVPTTPAPTTAAPTTSPPSTPVPTTPIPTTAPPTVVPTTTLTTTAPTTSVSTTSVPTTAPTTTLTTAPPTTVGPTTAPPPTIAPLIIDPDPIDIGISFYFVLNYNPPATINSELDQSGDAGIIEIVMSVIGEIKDKAPSLYAIEIEVSILSGGIDVGSTVTLTALELCSVVITGGTVILQLPRCNVVRWGKIGYFNFDIDESNIAGERPMDWAGCIYHIRKLGDKVVVYGENGVTLMKASGIHWGMDTIYRLGLKNKGAFAGSDSRHFFVNVLGELFQLDETLTKLDYSEYLSTMGTIILTLDIETNLLYICDGSKGYVYSPTSKSFGEGPENITGLGSKSNILYVSSDGEIVTPKLEICTDIYDFGTRKPKTIKSIELGTDVSDFLYVSVDYRMSHKDQFRQISWFLVNPAGKAWPKCHGVDFRFRVRSTVYEYPIELDYMKIRGQIHGFSWSDTQRVEGY